MGSRAARDPAHRQVLLKWRADADWCKRDGNAVASAPGCLRAPVPTRAAVVISVMNAAESGDSMLDDAVDGSGSTSPFAATIKPTVCDGLPSSVCIVMLAVSAPVRLTVTVPLCEVVPFGVVTFVAKSKVTPPVPGTKPAAGLWPTAEPVVANTRHDDKVQNAALRFILYLRIAALFDAQQPSFGFEGKDRDRRFE
jgi:hypothetical protein